MALYAFFLHQKLSGALNRHAFSQCSWYKILLRTEGQTEYLSLLKIKLILQLNRVSWEIIKYNYIYVVLKTEQTKLEQHVALTSIH